MQLDRAGEAQPVPLLERDVQEAELLRAGGGGMPAFEDTLSAQQINDVAAYVAERVAGSP